MSKTKQKNNNVVLKSAIAWVAVVAIAWAGYLGFSTWVQKVEANPDYICVKSVTNSPCQIDYCEDWGQDGQRVCKWERTTKIGYYHTRTTCEAWYTRQISWSTASSRTASNDLKNKWYGWRLDSEGKNAYRAHPSSGRHSLDYPYQTEYCQIIEQDTQKPGGGINVDI